MPYNRLLNDDDLLALDRGNMWIRKQFDIGWYDLLFGFSAAVSNAVFGRAQKRQQALSAIQESWPEEQASVFLSVRSGFDCLMATFNQSYAWQPGDEVIMSGLTIPDMPRIVEHHGLSVVAVDLNKSPMAPEPSTVARAITSNTRAIVIAHLFGNRIPLEPYAKVAREHNLILIEDCAQYFRPGYAGSPYADVSMFSFGPIKSCSALGGSVFQIRNALLREHVESKARTYRRQSNLGFAKRILKYCMLKGLSKRIWTAAIFRLIKLTGRDPDSVVSSMARGFSGSDFFDRIRHQPSTALLGLMARRLTTFELNKLEHRIEQASFLAGQLSPSINLAFDCTRLNDSTFWVTPVHSVSAETSRDLVAALSSEGFDATQRSSLVAVSSTDSGTGLPIASSFLDRMVLLPICCEMQLSDLEKMADIVNGVCLDGEVRALEAAQTDRHKSYELTTAYSCGHKPAEQTAPQKI